MTEEKLPSREELLIQIDVLSSQLQEISGSSHQNIKAQSQLESILHNAGEGVIIFNPDSTIKSLNLAAEKILGYTEVELMFQYAEQLFDVPSKYKQKVPLFLKSFLEEHPNADEYPLIGHHISGREVPLRLSISEIAIEEMMFFDDFTDDVLEEDEQNEDELTHEFELFACILHDLTDEIAAKTKLEEQNKKLENAYLSLSEQDRMRGEFLAKVSHELLTPLNGILGVADILNDEVADEHKEFVQVIQDSGHRLNSIIHNILVFDKKKANDDDVKHSFDLVKMVDEISSKHQKIIAKKSLNFNTTYQQDETEFRLFGFEHKVEGLLFNLIDNAVKFTLEGFIKLQFNLSSVDNSDSNKRLTIIIEDSGIGIDKNFQEDIFLPFTQLEDTVTRKFGGVGMGLSIVKQIVESLDGFIEVSSELGKGSTFTINICVKSSEQQIANISSIDNSKVSELKELLADDFDSFVHSIQLDLERHLDEIMQLTEKHDCNGLKTEFSILIVIAEQIGANKLISELEELQKTISEERSIEWIFNEVSKLAQEIQMVSSCLFKA